MYKRLINHCSSVYALFLIISIQYLQLRGSYHELGNCDFCSYNSALLFPNLHLVNDLPLLFLNKIIPLGECFPDLNYDTYNFFDAAEAILLGFQHYLVMLGTTVIIPTALVPQMGGGNVRIYSHTRRGIFYSNYSSSLSSFFSQCLLWFHICQHLLFQDEKARVIQTLLFVAGINTLLQTYFGTCLPAVMGGSYTFVVPTISIILAGRYSNIVDPHEVATRPRLD